MQSLIFKKRDNFADLFWRTITWHLRYLLTKKPSPLACGLYITSRCNFRCKFCNIWRKETTDTLSLDKAKAIVDNLSSIGCFYFSISGGEPLLFNEIFELLQYARKTRIKYLHMVTNGYLLDANKAAQFGKIGIDEISISIDGPESFHDHNRGMCGAYAKALAAIENLKNHAPRVNIVLNAIFSPEAPSECLHIVELARKFNVYAKVQPLNQHPLFNKENHNTVSLQRISPSEIKNAVTILRKETRVINSNIFLDNIYNFFCDRERLIFKNSPCLFGYHHIEILEDGRVFPCLEGLNWEGGFELNGELRVILNSPEYGNILNRLKRCTGCQRNYYICYYESRIAFPIQNFLKYSLS